eukprot:Rmarinus@m.4538
MFVYLSKKIAIPNGVKLRCLKWNTEQGWIACGGDNGLLKVLKLDMGDAKAKDPRNKGVSAPSNLSMNQTLEGHNGAVMVATWNENYRKLTTSDQQGLIIVWMLHKNIWFEEMINNRNKSVVRDMKWTADGQRICIVYEDGAVIVGSVDGNRLWGKEVKLNLSLVEWSPDGKLILFGTLQGDVHIYDFQGNPVSKLLVFEMEGQNARIVGIDWYDGIEGFMEPNQPTLALCYSNGRVTLMRHEGDEEPVLIDTVMRASKIQWSHHGNVLAVAGSQLTTLPNGEQREVSMVQFYNPFGQHLRTLKVPGSGIQSLSWEGGGLRIALAVDSFIYFANIRPDNKWGHFGNVIVYSFTKPERPEHCVIFWDTKTDERHAKYVKKLLAIRAAGEYCVLATKADDSSGQYILILCNAMGSPVDSKYIDIEPVFLTMTDTHVVVASEEIVYVWQYRTMLSKLTSLGDGGGLRKDKGRERVFHVDDAPSSSTGGFDKFRPPEQPTNDSITCVCASDKFMLVGRESGTLHRYTLPHTSLDSKHVLRCRPQQIALNCNSQRLSIIDIHGVLSFFDLDARAEDGSGRLGLHLPLERKDVWDMCWADDNPELFAMMEKTRMYIFRGLDPEEPVMSSGYLCQFSDLEVKAVLMDEVMKAPEHPDRDYVINFETKALRDTRELLQVGLPECYKFVEDNPHPRLWRLVAESALAQLDFGVADKAFVSCQDYQGIQFVKRLKMLNDKTKQRAEVEAYFRNFTRAEELYMELDRKDLAVELRMRMGDWFRVVDLVQAGGGDDTLWMEAHNRIGDYYADRQKWAQAVKHYANAKNNVRLVDCYYALEEYKNLERLIDVLPEGHACLSSIGDKFASVGLAEQSVQAYLRGSDIKGAIDACVHLNEWNRAIELAEKFEFSQIEGLLTKYANHHLEKGETLQAIALYRKAGRHTDAAKLLAQLAKESAETKVNPLRAKKLYLLSALEVERNKRKQLDAAAQFQGSGAGTTAATHTLEGLVQHERMTANDKMLLTPWRGAEAYHFFLLAQRQLYEGYHEFAMKTAYRLQDYDDILDPIEVYSLLGMASYYSKSFATCSKAFVKLETLPTIESKKHEVYADLALDIFSENPPKDPTTTSYKCPQCSQGGVKDWDTHCPGCNMNFPACVATGRSILGHTEVYTCFECKHKADIREIRKYHHCPLCHAVLQLPNN